MCLLFYFCPRGESANTTHRKSQKKFCSSQHDLRGLYVHVDPSLFSPEAATAVRTRFGMRRAYLEFHVGMYVVADPTCAGQLKTWSAVLGGCLLADSAFFNTGGATGICVSYVPQITLERKFVSASNCRAIRFKWWWVRACARVSDFGCSQTPWCALKRNLPFLSHATI